MRATIPALAAVLLLAACGSDGGHIAPGTDPGGALRTVEVLRADGTVAEKGTVLVTADGEVRHGAWRRWFPDGALQWQGSYAHGALDAASPWREWNADGSVRDDWRDAVDDG